MVVQIIAALVSLAAFIAVIYSLRQVNRNLLSNSVARIYSEIHQVHRAFIEHPDLRPYFYNNKGLNKDNPHYLRGLAIAEMFFDIFEHLYYLKNQANKIVELNWRSYIGHMLENSNFLCEYLQENRELIFPVELREFLDNKIGKVLNSDVENIE